MKLHRYLALGLFAFAASQAAWAQFNHGTSDPLPADPSTKPSDLKADQLLARAAAARGGDAKLKAVQAVTMTGKMETKQISSSPVTLTITPGHLLRRTEIKGGIEMIKAVDGQNAWEITPQAGITKPAPMVSKEAARYRRLADPQGPLVDAATKGNKVEILGKMAWQKSQVYKVKVTFKDGGVNYLYLDDKTYLLVRVVNTMFVPQLNKEVDVEVLYLDYRDVDGVKWAFKEKVNAPEVGFAQELRWEKIEVNKPIAAGIFKQPS